MAGRYAIRELGSVWQGTGGLAAAPAYAKLMANTASIAQLTGRNLTSASNSDNSLMIVAKKTRRSKPTGFSRF